MALLRWQRTIVDEAGNVIPNADIEVRNEGAGTLASLFTDRDGTTPAGNPITADGDGYAFFYVDVGRYLISATDGLLTREWRDVVLPDERVNLDARYYTQDAADALFAVDADVPKLTGGADANFTAMPQVGGDPIVESGSNSDGDWTRWADGSQKARHNLQAAGQVNLATGNVFQTGSAIWTFPAAFISPPTVSHTENSGVGTCWGGLGTGATNNTLTTFNLFRATALSGIPVAGLSAFGYWK